jgi:16S rRNA (cytosine1407-C5)-methyltransferase
MDSELDKYLRLFLGKRYNNYVEAQPEPRAIRVNLLKSSAVELESFIQSLNYSIEKIPFGSDGYILRHDFVPLSHTLFYFTGQFMYQGVSSQLPVLCLDVQPGDRVLDLTAAPGSKSTQLAAMMNNQGMLVLNDYSTSRMQALNANMQRCGVTNYTLLKHRGQDLGRLLPNIFDKVLCDVPCTATGTLNAHPEIRSWWNTKKLYKLANIQYYLLVSAIKTLKTGGELVYSTCSIAPEENEQVINRVLQSYPVEVIPAPNHLKVSFEDGLKSYNGEIFDKTLRHAIRIFPDEHQMEGFFVIRLRKTGSTALIDRTIAAGWINTLDRTHSTVSEILGELSTEWGIPEAEWTHYRYYRTKTRLWMLTGNIHTLPVNGFVSSGLLLAEKRIHGWKLVTASVQYFSRFISRRRLTLPDETLVLLFKEGKIDHKTQKDGYYALIYQDEPIASVFAHNDQIMLRLPHSFNLVL